MAASIPSRQGSGTLFSPASPKTALAILLLLENSVDLFSIWSRTRERYMEPVLRRVEKENPGAPTTVIVLDSSQPRRYENIHQALSDVHLTGGDRLSAGKIQEGVEYLAATGYDETQVSRHMFLVATSRPCGDLIDSIHSVWHALAGEIAKTDVHLHMLLRSNEDMSKLTTLFYETLRLQHHVEHPFWFPPEHSDFAVRLSVRAPSSKLSHPRASNSKAMIKSEALPIEGTDKESGRWHYPTTMYPNEHPGAPGSLVARLQHEHGLTKKKVHSRPPPRKPFIVDEPYDDRPTSVSLTPVSRPGHSDAGYSNANGSGGGYGTAGVGKRPSRRRSKASERGTNPYPSPHSSPPTTPHVGGSEDDHDWMRPTFSPSMSPATPSSPPVYLSPQQYLQNLEDALSSMSSTSSPAPMSPVPLSADGASPLASYDYIPPATHHPAPYGSYTREVSYSQPPPQPSPSYQFQGNSPYPPQALPSGPPPAMTEATYPAYSAVPQMYQAPPGPAPAPLRTYHTAPTAPPYYNQHVQQAAPQMRSSNSTSSLSGWAG